MNLKNVSVSLLLLTGLSCVCPPHADEENRVINRSLEIDVKHQDQVILIEVKNTSQDVVRLWHLDCSMGDGTLYFIMENEGAFFSVEPILRAFTRDYPRWEEVAPGASITYSIDFYNGQWDIPVGFEVEGARIGRVVLDVPVTVEAIEADVWYGCTESVLLDPVVVRNNAEDEQP